MSGEAGNPHTGLEIGRTLEVTRERRGLSLQQVEEATKIRTRYLRDLENENFDVLPAVYMLGSLKTYAEYLGLDGAAMSTELKRRQRSVQAEQDQEALEEPPPGEPRGLLASLTRLLGIGKTVEDEAGAMSDPGRSPGLYVSLAVVLIFIFATYLASSLREDQPSVSQVREPKTSQSPSGVAMVGNVGADERNTEDVNKDKQAEPPATDAGNDDKARTARSGQGKYALRTAQASSSSATAFAGASASAPEDASASASPASTGSASAPATATPVPTRVRPEPVARERSDDAGRAKAVDPPDGPSARAPGSRNLRPGFQRKQAGSLDSTRPGKRIPTKVKISTTVEKLVDPAR